MIGAVLTHIGLEDISAKEVNELIGKECSIKKGFVYFKINNLNELALLSYIGRSFIRVFLVISSGKFDIDEMNKIKLDVDNYYKKLVKNKSFSLRYIKNNNSNDNINRFEIEPLFGGLVKDIFDLNVNLKNPDVQFFVIIIDDDYFLCIDIPGFDLSKRDYKIFQNRDSIKGTIAYSLARLSNFSNNNVLLDPFCKDGTIIIESALYIKRRSPHYFIKDKFRFDLLDINFDFNSFDKDVVGIKDANSKIIGYDDNFPSIRASKKNANIAGVLKEINISRLDVKWIDTKFDHSVDAVVTKPVEPSNRINKRKVENIYNDLFNNLNFILKKQGVFVSLLRDPILIKQIGERYNFKSSERIIFTGKQKMSVVTFTR